jgi:hypothetical protein
MGLCRGPDYAAAVLKAAGWMACHSLRYRHDNQPLTLSDCSESSGHHCVADHGLRRQQWTAGNEPVTRPAVLSAPPPPGGAGAVLIDPA